ncbi:hypothetical protein FIBSPDRAFT_67367 [Athelia psychrophila]|uniref:Uncharacterized protein n=1 Tax=Athelia psychrophila TaxID=1759441 RepID=A0A166EUZ7_9AGAM|nr:hypothetical protein FIBSPDRAFT_67367 [Fibularhizoctonia sp. CBS 109695]
MAIMCSTCPKRRTVKFSHCETADWTEAHILRGGHCHRTLTVFIGRVLPPEMKQMVQIQNTTEHMRIQVEMEISADFLCFGNGLMILRGREPSEKEPRFLSYAFKEDLIARSERYVRIGSTGYNSESPNP